MAENKKAFIVYTDWKKYTDEMTTEQTGQWIKWCLDYCNDLQPNMPNDIAVKMLCIMCKDILKRDLKKYENKVISIKNAREQRRYNIENNNEINIENNNDINIATSGVNSNKLIVNSNKCISNDILNNACACEESQINDLKSLISELEKTLNRCLTIYETETITDLSEKYSNKQILDEVIENKDKTNQ